MSKTLHCVVSEVYDFTVDPVDIMKKSFQIVHLEGEWMILTAYVLFWE